MIIKALLFIYLIPIIHMTIFDEHECVPCETGWWNAFYFAGYIFAMFMWPFIVIKAIIFPK